MMAVDRMDIPGWHFLWYSTSLFPAAQSRPASCHRSMAQGGFYKWKYNFPWCSPVFALLFLPTTVRTVH